MDTKKLNTTIEEAKRFLDRAKELKDLISEEDKKWKEAKEKGEHYWISNNPKESGAVRRASMDLSRALSALRKY
jgi:hypothetical protein